MEELTHKITARSGLRRKEGVREWVATPLRKNDIYGALEKWHANLAHLTCVTSYAARAQDHSTFSQQSYLHAALPNIRYATILNFQGTKWQRCRDAEQSYQMGDMPKVSLLTVSLYARRCVDSYLEWKCLASGDLDLDRSVCVTSKIRWVANHRTLWDVRESELSAILWICAIRPLLIGGNCR